MTARRGFTRRRSGAWVAVLVGAVVSLALAACSGSGKTSAAGGGATTTTAPAMDRLVRLNQVQEIGTHNSYHRRVKPGLLEKLHAFSAKLADSIDYEHAPLDQQFDGGVRQIELDVFADPEGGHFATRAANVLTGEPKDTGIAELQAPGFKVLHIQEIDYESTCLSFVSCLRTIDKWSSAHPHHLPIMVMVEAKDSGLADPAHLGFVPPVPIGAPEFDALDAEVRSVFGANRLITPDVVRGAHATLREAVTAEGWPTLAQSRGKVMFCLISDDEGKRAIYAQGHPSLQGRAMFSLATPDTPESAVISRPDATTESADIAALAKQGFLVRTRSDADTVEARANDVRRRDAALASAATWISTDYTDPDSKLATGYSVRLPSGGLFRCNPVLAPPGCRDSALEPSKGG